MIQSLVGLPNGTRVWVAAGLTDMRKGFNGLAAIAQLGLNSDPYSGHVFVFRGKSGSLIKLLWWSGVSIVGTFRPVDCRHLEASWMA